MSGASSTRGKTPAQGQTAPLLILIQLKTGPARSGLVHQIDWRMFKSGLKSMSSTCLLMALVAGSGCRYDNPRFGDLGQQAAEPGTKVNKGSKHKSENKPGNVHSISDETTGGAGSVDSYLTATFDETQVSAESSTGEASRPDVATSTSESSNPSTSGLDSTSQSSSASSTPEPVIPANCGKGPALCYLVDDKDAAMTIRDARGTGLDLQVKAGTASFGVSQDAYYPKGARYLHSSQGNIIAQASRAWSPPGKAIGFELYVRFDRGNTPDQVIFGIPGRLVLVADHKNGVTCKYIVDGDDGKPFYVSSGGWSNPSSDVWSKVVCAYDGHKVGLWVNDTSLRSYPWKRGVFGESHSMAIGGKLGAPALGVYYGGLHGSIASIRIWTDMQAFAADTAYQP